MFFSKPVPYDQKRSTQRIGCRFSTICEQGKTAFNATVVDLGAEGMRLAVPRKLKAGTRLNVSARKDLEGSSIQVEVRWCNLKRFTSIIEVGGVYCSPLAGTWVERALAELGLSAPASERRKAVRAPVSDDFTLPVQVNQTMPGKADNLGMGGVCVVLGHPLPPEGLVDVVIGPYYSLKALKLRAQIIHQHPTPFGDSWAYGLGFNQLTSAQRALLSSYLDQLLKARADS